MPTPPQQKRTSEEADSSENTMQSQTQSSSQDERNVKTENGSQPTESDTNAPTVQKRRRVTRACDECRKKKIRCDGKQPCTHCTVYSYECSYDQPSNRRRNPAPVFLEAMEQKLQRAESLLQLCFPNVPLDDPRFDTLLRESQESDAGIPSLLAKFNALDPGSNRSAHTTEPDSDLESMVTSKGALDQNDRGEYDYFGSSSGFHFLRRMSEEFGHLVNAKKEANSLPPSEVSAGSMSSVMMNVPSRWAPDSPFENDNSIDDLPSRNKARRLVQFALDDACAIIPCVHRPSFNAAFDRIYDLPPEEYTNQDHRFLPLLYVVIALGCLFAKDEGSELERKGYLSATDEGYKYFWAGRQLMDITDCRDLVSLQAVIFMILFLQCSAKLATCYAFIGVALRSALRMGMHRSFQDSFNPIESELRKRCFWIIRKMDVFTGAMLGLPLTLNDHDIDQDFPTEVDDDCITMDGIKQQHPDHVSVIAATNQDFRLTMIVQKIIKNIYPIKGFQSQEQPSSRVYNVRLSTIKDIERDLKAWEDQLHPVFKPGYDAPPVLLRVRNLLRMAFAHVQLLLYRPFLHYVSARSSVNAQEAGSQACAAACVHVSRNIIHITASMNQNGLLVGSYWFTMYTSFFAILSLVFYALENAGISQEIMRDAIVGRQTLAVLAKRSMAADRCTATLTVLFDQISARLKEGSSAPTSHRRSNQRSQTHPGINNNQYAYTNGTHSGMQKAATIPTPSLKSNAPPLLAPRPQPSGQHHPPTSMPATNGQQHFPMQSNMPSNQQNSHHGFQMMPFSVPGQHGPQHPDATQFSNLIFPSPDPIAYPNQPMLSLDQYGGLDHAMSGVSGAGDGFVSASTAPSNTVTADEFVDVNMMAMQHDSNGAPGHTHPHHHAGHMSFMENEGLRMDVDQGMAESAGINFPGLDFADFFGGGDWSQR